MTRDDAVRGTLVLLRHRGLDPRVPPELLEALALQPADVARVGTAGFTALLSERQRTAARGSALVAALHDNPQCLAPLLPSTSEPDVPDRYVVCMLPGGDPARIAADTGIAEHELEVAGKWLIVTLSDAQLAALRRAPDVDFVTPAVMTSPAGL